MKKFNNILYDEFNIEKNIPSEDIMKYDGTNITLSLKKNISKFKGLLCEVQLTTVLSHAMNEFGHNIVYKDTDELDSKDSKEYENIKAIFSEVREDILKIMGKLEFINHRVYSIKSGAKNIEILLGKDFKNDLENVKLKDMDGNLYHKFQQELWDKPIKCSSRNDIQKFLKIILNWGMKMYDINLMRFYKKIEFFKDPNEMKEEKDVYTFEEFQKYIKGATNLNDKTMFEMLYYCGLRRGECRGLQWSDIDWNNKLVSITKQANSIKDSQKYYELTPPKTQKSIRTLPLTDVLYNDLVNLYNEKKKYYGFNEKWFIFGELDPLTFGMMHRINGRIAESANIRRIPLHSFRYSCASLLINTGQPVTTVSKYLGHASTKETLDTYAHMFPNNLTNVKNTIDNLNLGI